MMDHTKLEQLVAAWLDGRISEDESSDLQRHLRESGEARKIFRSYASLDSAIREVAGGDVEQPVSPPIDLPRPLQGRTSKTSRISEAKQRNTRLTQLALAAAALIVVGGVTYQLGRVNSGITTKDNKTTLDNSNNVAEKTISGYATLTRIAGVQWNSDAGTYREGDVLPAGDLEFSEGVAEIDFFCGATLIVEGPAKLNLESDWCVRLLEGRLRANVPPAARGFIVKAADSEIIDLGTEFALEVNSENVRVEVVDGEIELRGGAYDGEHLVTGEGQSLKGAKAKSDSLRGLSTTGDVLRRHESARKQRFEQWKTSSRKLRKDKRLIAYFPIAESNAERFILNAAASGAERDGTLVGLVDRTKGRFGSVSTGLEFDRPGSRVRTLIEGEYEALTFACWVRIDSLDHFYNALFMADGYENGEPHWQIHNDGRLMFSVMVDETKGFRHYSSDEGQYVESAGLARVYYSKPIWDFSRSGQWLHVAAVYDPVNKRVEQYLNGQQVGSDEIVDKFHIKTLKIGAAEIGNWGQPFRKTPSFAVRNLNGAIDELAIFDSALNSGEIIDLYEQGKPGGY